MAGASIGSAIFNSGTSDIMVTSIGSNTAKTTSYSISITPSLGWFISGNTAVGVSLNINPAGQKTSYEENGNTFQKDKTSDFNAGIGGFARNYFSSNGTFLPFGQAGLTMGISNYKSDGFFYGGSGVDAYKKSYKGNSSGGFFTNASLTGGFTKKIGENTGLDLYIGYTFSFTKNTLSTTTLVDMQLNGTIDERLENETMTKFTNHGFMIGAGFQVFLAKKKK